VEQQVVAMSQNLRVPQRADPPREPSLNPTPVGLPLTPKEVAGALKISVYWLAKARMRGDGPPYVKVGRAVRYDESALRDWFKSQSRSSTSER